MIDPSKTYRTRDGQPVRIYATDGVGTSPIHGAYYSTMFKGYIFCGWDQDGEPTTDGPPERVGLVEVTLSDELRDQIPWETLRPEIRWVAMDDEGDWHGFTEDEPIRKSEGYWMRSGLGTVFHLRAISMPKVDPDRWDETLVERPEDT